MGKYIAAFLIALLLLPATSFARHSEHRERPDHRDAMRSGHEYPDRPSLSGRRAGGNVDDTPPDPGDLGLQ